VFKFLKNKVLLRKNLYETSKLYENGLGEQESCRSNFKIHFIHFGKPITEPIRLQEITLQMLNRSMGLDLTAPQKLKEENLED